MSILNTRDDLVSTFLGAWTDTPVEVGNVRGTPDGNPYALIQIVPFQGTQPSLGRDTGATWERDTGDCIIGIHVPVNYEEDGLALAEKARSILSQQRFNDTITDSGYTVTAGVAPDDPRYYVYQVRIPYRTDNLKS
jgi:hypothetical protein